MYRLRPLLTSTLPRTLRHYTTHLHPPPPQAKQKTPTLKDAIQKEQSVTEKWLQSRSHEELDHVADRLRGM